MSDPDKPAFNVVDRRRAAQQEASASPTAEAVPADTSSPETNANPAAPSPAPDITEAQSAADVSSASSGEAAQDTPDNDFDATGPDGDMPRPDPAALLSYVAMQMDVKSLAATLLGVFAGQAWRAMGLVANPVTGQTDKNLPEAQTAIDCVQFLLGKIESDLPEPERREIQRRLNDLRMNYITKLREG